MGRKKKKTSKQIKISNIKKTEFVINGSFRHTVLCGQNWIAIIAISKMKTLGEKKIEQKWHGNYSL